MMQIRGTLPIYIASKLRHADRWKSLRNNWANENINIVSRWIEQASLEESAHPTDFKVFWSVDEEDVSKSEVILIYIDRDETLRGALVEAGMGIAMGKMVIVAGDFIQAGTWIYHPRVYCVETLDHAKALIINRFGR